MNQQEIIRNFNDDGSICLDPSLSEEEETEIGNNPTPEEMEKRKTFSGATRRFLSKLLKSGVPYEVALDTIIKRKSARGEVFSGVSKINLEREKESSSEPGCSMRYLSDAGTAEHSSVKSHLESTIGEIREGTLLPDYPVSSLNISSEEEEIEIGNNPTPEEMEKRKKFPGATRRFLSKLLKSGVPYEVALETIIKRNAERGEVSSGVSKINLERVKVSPSEPGCSKRYLSDASTGEHSTMKSHLANSIGEIREEIFRPEYPISSLNIDSDEEEIEIGNNPTPVEIEKRKIFGGATSKFLSNLLKSGMPYEVALEAVIKRSAQNQLSGATSSGGSRINLEREKTPSELGYSKRNLSDTSTAEHRYNEEKEMEIGNNPTPEEKEKRIKFPGATRKRLSKLLKSGIPYEIALETVIKEKAQRQQRGEAFGGRKTNPEGGKTPSEPGYSKRYLSDASTEVHSAMKSPLESCTGEIREGTLRPDYLVSSLNISSEEEEMEIGNNTTPEDMEKRKKIGDATKKLLSKLIKTGMPYEEALETASMLGEATSSGGILLPDYPDSSLNISSEEEEMEIGNNPTPVEIEKRKRFGGATRKRLSRLLKSGMPYDEALETIIKGKAERQQGGEASLGGSQFNSEGGKRNLSDASTAEHSTKKSRRDEIIKVGILRPDYPQNCLTSEQFALLKRSILAALDAVIKDGPQLRFHSCVNRNGWVLYNCADEISAEWLEGTIKSLSPWQGAELKTVRGEDIPESQVCEVFIPDDVPGKKPSSTVVLNRLRCMNRGLLTDKWRILRRSDIGFGRILTFVIDEKSMFVLRRNDYLAFFGFGRVTFQPKEDVSSGGVKSPTS